MKIVLICRFLTYVLIQIRYYLLDWQLYGRNLIWKKRKPSQTINNGIFLQFTWYFVTVITGLFDVLFLVFLFKYVLHPVLRIRIRIRIRIHRIRIHRIRIYRNHMFLGLPDPDPDSLAEVWIQIRIRLWIRIRILLSARKICKKNLDSYCDFFLTFYL